MPHSFPNLEAMYDYAKHNLDLNVVYHYSGFHNGEVCGVYSLDNNPKQKYMFDKNDQFIKMVA